MLMQEIKDLLDRVLVFESSFKETILVKAQNLDEVKLVELKKILQEVSGWQEKVLDKMAKNDPGFVVRLANAKREAEREVMILYKQKLEEEDRGKMEIILNKMRSL